MPMFSIVMPVYNLERYVSAALDSVLAQTFTDWECICVDDGSTDESGRILGEYARQDSRIRVIHQQNGGEGAARNAGLSTVRGGWVLLLDGDDMWHPQLLDSCAQAISHGGEIDAIRFEFCDFNDGDTWRPQLFDSKDLHESDYSCSAPLNELLASGPFCGHAYRAEIICLIRQKSLCVGTDRDSYFQCLLKMRNVRFLQGQPLYGYRRRPGSAILSRMTLRKAIDDITWRFNSITGWCEAGRCVDLGYTRSVAVGLTESVAASFALLTSMDRALAWKHWLTGMDKLNSNGIFHGWWRVSAKMCHCTHSLGLFMLCYYVPYRLKRLGIHR